MSCSQLSLMVFLVAMINVFPARAQDLPFEQTTAVPAQKTDFITLVPTENGTTLAPGTPGKSEQVKNTTKVKPATRTTIATKPPTKAPIITILTTSGVVDPPTTNETGSDNEVVGSPSTAEAYEFSNTKEIVESPTTYGRVKPPATKEPVEPFTTSKEAVEPPTTKKPVEPPTNKKAVKPLTTKDTTEPSTTKEVLKPPTTDGAVEPPTNKKAVKPPTSKEAAEPRTTKEAFEPPTTKEAVEPRTTKKLVEPPTNKKAVEPPTIKEAVKPPTSKDAVESPTTKEAFDISSTKEEFEPHTTKEVVEPSTINDAVRPPTAKPAIEPPTTNEADPSTEPANRTTNERESENQIFTSSLFAKSHTAVVLAETASNVPAELATQPTPSAVLQRTLASSSGSDPEQQTCGYIWYNAHGTHEKVMTLVSEYKRSINDELRSLMDRLENDYNALTDLVNVELYNPAQCVMIMKKSGSHLGSHLG